MAPKIRLVNRKRFVLASLALISFIIFAITLIDFLTTSKSAWRDIESREGSAISNQKIVLEAEPKEGSILYPGNTITVSAHYAYTLKDTGENKTFPAGKKVEMRCSDPSIGIFSENYNLFTITQQVMEAKEFSITATFENEAKTFLFKVVPSPGLIDTTK
ncbi:MAG: hypothetical protein FWG30_00270 [Eubacteriaceae bacterium]|nr:hypothetical protein [Eubacteriaceae bacterium]